MNEMNNVNNTNEMNENVPVTVSVPREEAKRYFLKVGIGILLLPLLTTALQYAFAFLFAAVAPNAYHSWWFSWVLSTVPLYCITFPLFLYVLPKPAAPLGEKRKLGAGRFIVACFVTVSAMYLFNIVSVYFMEIIRTVSGGSLGKTNTLNEIVSASPTWVTIAIACVLGPIMEEVIFRKVLISRLVPFGELRACVLSAVVFGLFHGNFNQFFYATALGLIFGYVYVKTRNIFYSIGLHMGINLIGSVIVPNLLSNKNLEAFERIAADPTNVSNADALAALVLIGTLLIGGAVIIAGVVLFFVFLRKIKFDAPALESDDGKTSKMMFFNAGMIAAAVVMTAIFVLSLL